VIQASVDLVTWVDVAAGVVPANGAINYTESSGSSYRFYRLFLPP